MAAEGRCSSLPLMLVTMKRVPQVAGVRLRFASAVPCQCAIAVFILRDRDGAFSLSRDPAARALASILRAAWSGRLKSVLAGLWGLIVAGGCDGSAGVARWAGVQGRWVFLGLGGRVVCDVR